MSEGSIEPVAAGGRLVGVDVFWVSVIVVAIYYIPLMSILYAGIETAFFTKDPKDFDPSSLVTRLNLFYGSFARDSLATLFVPLITTYTVLRSDVSGKLPVRAFVLLTTFLVMFLLATYLYVKINPALLPRYELVDFSKILESYAKESLTYVALVLGGTAKRS